MSHEIIDCNPEISVDVLGPTYRGLCTSILNWYSNKIFIFIGWCGLFRLITHYFMMEVVG